VRACIGIPGREAKAKVNLQITIIALTCDQQEGKTGIHPKPSVHVQRGLGIRVILDGTVNVGLLLVGIDGGGNCQPTIDVVGMLLLWILGVVHEVFFGQREGANTNEATVNHTIVIIVIISATIIIVRNVIFRQRKGTKANIIIVATSNVIIIVITAYAIYGSHPRQLSGNLCVDILPSPTR
jgi:lysylphosphatidylglycerol synthetase-like protein (DUF2156 family)